VAFASAEREYRARAECLRAWHTPRHWLDVGTGHGHFCVHARRSWASTEFDGLDMSGNVDAAERRGWVRRGHRGLFPELAPKLEGEYDVISMFHYLEHTREPLAELAAAAHVLEPGGYLLIEVPDPECAYGRLLGSRWVCWFQPQHLHFLPLANLRAALERQGFQVRSEERGTAHIPADFSFALFSSLADIARPVYLPWAPPDPWWRPLWRFTAFAVAGPFLALTLVFDRLLAVGAARWGWPSNTYRVLAQKPS
jgi:SAM-dependent methyltransferase